LFDEEETKIIKRYTEAAHQGGDCISTFSILKRKKTNKK
jgi:hypothetical protein